MKKLLAATMVGTMVLSVSCGMGDTASLNNAKTSAYSVTNNDMSYGTTKTGYVPSTYSANRVKYYDGLYNDNYTTNTTNGYKDVRDNTDANYLKNTYVNSNTMYNNEMYKDLSATDFNNGLVTYEHNTDTTNDMLDGIDVDRVATNALNYSGGASKTMMSGVYNNERKIDTVTTKDTTENIDRNNDVDYDVNNTYDEMMDATEDLVYDVTTDAKVAVNKAKVETKKMVNNMEY